MIGITILGLLAGVFLAVLLIGTNAWLGTLLERRFGFDFHLAIIGLYFTQTLLLGIVLTLLHI